MMAPCHDDGHTLYCTSNLASPSSWLSSFPYHIYIYTYISNYRRERAIVMGDNRWPNSPNPKVPWRCFCTHKTCHSRELFSRHHGLVFLPSSRIRPPVPFQFRRFDTQHTIEERDYLARGAKPGAVHITALCLDRKQQLPRTGLVKYLHLSWSGTGGRHV